MEAAWEASSLIESLDLEVHLRYTIDGLHSFQKALDIYSVQDNILGTEIFLFWKFMHEPHYLHVSGVILNRGQAVHASSQHLVAGSENSAACGSRGLNQGTKAWCLRHSAPLSDGSKAVWCARVGQCL